MPVFSGHMAEFLKPFHQHFPPKSPPTTGAPKSGGSRKRFRPAAAWLLRNGKHHLRQDLRPNESGQLGSDHLGMYPRHSMGLPYADQLGWFWGVNLIGIYCP